MEILARGEYGVLSTLGPDGQPYGIPVNYAYRHPILYFHCAQDGHKIDNLRYNPRVAFCVVGTTRVLPEQFATEYESAMAFGVASEVTGPERLDALIWLLEKYSPEHVDAGKAYIARKAQVTKVIKIEITELTAKARRG